jgi:hypothetical protein
VTINRENANAIFEGARNASGGERQFAAGRKIKSNQIKSNQIKSNHNLFKARAASAVIG